MADTPTPPINPEGDDAPEPEPGPGETTVPPEPSPDDERGESLGDDGTPGASSPLAQPRGDKPGPATAEQFPDPDPAADELRQPRGGD